jgi:hypothetical protein
MALFRDSAAGDPGERRQAAGWRAEHIGLQATLTLNGLLFIVAGLLRRRRLHSHPESEDVGRLHAKRLSNLSTPRIARARAAIVECRSSTAGIAKRVRLAEKASANLAQTATRAGQGPFGAGGLGTQGQDQVARLQSRGGAQMHRPRAMAEIAARFGPYSLNRCNDSR